MCEHILCGAYVIWCARKAVSQLLSLSRVQQVLSLSRVQQVMVKYTEPHDQKTKQAKISASNVDVKGINPTYYQQCEECSWPPLHCLHMS